MTITLRTTKGSALTHQELDANFSSLDTRVGGLDSEIVVVQTAIDELNANQVDQTEQTAPMGGADAVWITGWSEFSYGTQPVIDDGQNAPNAVLDQRVNLTQGDRWEADFLHVIRDDLSRTQARKVVLWYQWVTYKDALGVVSPRLSYNASLYLHTDPDIYTIDCSAVGGVRWNVDGTDGGTACPVGPNILNQPGGTVCDAALVQGVRELVARGYEVGICPVVSFSDPTKFATGDYLYWRGQATWPDIATLNSWLADYKIMHRHSMELFKAANSAPWIVYVGSEMRWLSAEASSSLKSAWFLAMQDLADEWKAAFPDCKITYSASDHEVGYTGGGFPMDALWSYPSVDYVGYSWYKPLTVEHTNDIGQLRAGVLSGERVDYTTNYFDMEAGRWLSAGTGTGKSTVALTGVPAAESWQNGAAAWRLAHYADRRYGVVACTSPLKGHHAGMCDGLGSSSVIFGDLSGTASLGQAPTATRNQGPGLAQAPAVTDYFLACNGVTYAKTNFPSTINYPITSFKFRVVFKPITAADLYPRILRIKNMDGTTVCTIEADRTTTTAVAWKLRYTDATLAAHYLTIATLNEATPAVQDWTIELSSTEVVINGVSSASVTPVMPTASADLYLGAYNETSNPLQCEVYYASFEGFSAATNRRIGGQWYFEDKYAGVRSPWAMDKAPMASEVGFASITGSCVEPNVFPVLKYGAGTLPSPAWFTDRAYWLAKGVEDIQGPFGSTFNPDQLHQARCLTAAVTSLREAGFAHQVAYNLDARPAGAFAATLAGSDYYGDAAVQRISHVLNGKIAGGYTGAPVSYTVTQPAPSPLASAGQCNIFYVRHADTARDVADNYIRDFTVDGDAQVAALPAKLAALGVPIDVVICSPTWRTMNTIKPWLASNGMVAEIWPELTETSWDAIGVEVDPVIEGGILLSLADEKVFKLRERGWGTLGSTFPYTARIYGGTPAAGLPLAQFVDALIRARFAGKGVNVLIVGHYHLGSRLVELLQGGTAAVYDPAAPVYQTSNTGIHILKQDCTSGDFILEQYNDTLLYGGLALPASSPHYPGTHSYTCW